MINDILFKNIILSGVCISSFDKLRENLKELSDTVFVSDDGEWKYKINVAIKSFEGIDASNLDIKSLEKIIRDVQEFVDIIENTSPLDNLELNIIKDFSYIKNKLSEYEKYLKKDTNHISFSHTSLEIIADFICGDDISKYPIYRSSFYLTKFFKDIGIDVQHDGSTRKIWVLSILSNLSVWDLNRVVLKLVDIKIYKGNKEDWNKAINSMNEILFLEDLKLQVEGKNVSIVTYKETHSEPESFISNITDHSQGHAIKAGGSVTAGGDIIVNGNKIESFVNKSDNHWYQKPVGAILITAIGGVIVAWISYSLGLN